MITFGLMSNAEITFYITVANVPALYRAGTLCLLKLLCSLVLVCHV